jgi:5-methylcytosine-specific restriction protein A
MTTIAERAGVAHRMTRKPSRLATLKPRLATADLRAVKPEPKRADAELQTPEHRRWRAQGLARAGHRCEDCGRSGVRLYADHIIERRDGGALYDPENCRIRCPSCHQSKTYAERAKRIASKLIAE